MFRHAIEQPSAPLGEVDPPQPFQRARPALRDDREQHQRMLPMLGKLAGVIGQQARRRHFLDEQLVERARQIAREAHRLGGIGVGPRLRDQPREDHPALERRHRGRHRLRVVGGIERRAPPPRPARDRLPRPAAAAAARPRSRARRRPGSRVWRGCWAAAPRRAPAAADRPRSAGSARLPAHRQRRGAGGWRRGGDGWAWARPA